MHYILCKDNNWTKTLEKELKADFTKETKIIGDLPLVKIPTSTDLKSSYIAFSTTALINCVKFQEDSVSKQALKIIESLNTTIDNDQKINYHVFSLTDKYGVIETGRAEIFNEKIRQGLKKKNIYCLRKGFDRSLGFLQILILADRSVAVSFIPAQDMDKYHSLVSPFVGGFNNEADDIKAPSRAFKKIVEAQKILGTPIKETDTLVDLGACPGGWTYIARKSGANVVAIDRTALREDLMEDKGVVFKKTDAFKFIPGNEIQWVVSDIICAPERILELLDNWVTNKRCEKFVFTIKFQGYREYGVLKKFKNYANQTDYKIIIKQLNANKNEVTIMGSV